MDGELETDLYMNPANCHKYLHYLSSHPKHTIDKFYTAMLFREGIVY